VNPSTRRTLLKQGLGLGLAAGLPAFLPHSALAGEKAAGRAPILVVLQLSGGNDGLSTVVPFERDDLYRLRKSTALPKKDLIKLDDQTGLHPNLKPLESHYKEGRVAIVQGAGYPNPNRSHFKSMDIWHSADLSGRRRGTGWLSRVADIGFRGVDDAELLINVGSQLPFALLGGSHKAISFQDVASYQWLGKRADKKTFDGMNEAKKSAALLSKLRRTASDARASSERVRAAAAGYKPKVTYPRESLARSLQLVAGLVAARLPTRVYYLSLGGFDTHTQQRNRHDNLMRNIGSSIAAFLADLKATGHADEVAVMAFSEFGRRPKENGSGGTDHGTAGPMFLFGNPVAGGLYGAQPSLTDLDKNRDLKMTVDFRSVYQAATAYCLGKPVQGVLDAKFPKLPLFS